MPKIDPASEKMTMSVGMSSPSRWGRAVIVAVRRRMPKSTAPVS